MTDREVVLRLSDQEARELAEVIRGYLRSMPKERYIAGKGVVPKPEYLRVGALGFKLHRARVRSAY